VPDPPFVVTQGRLSFIIGDARYGRVVVVSMETGTEAQGGTPLSEKIAGAKGRL